VSDYRRDERIDGRPYGSRYEYYEYYDNGRGAYYDHGGGNYDDRRYYDDRRGHYYDDRRGAGRKPYRNGGYRYRGDD